MQAQSPPRGLSLTKSPKSRQNSLSLGGQRAELPEGDTVSKVLQEKGGVDWNVSRGSRERRKPFGAAEICKGGLRPFFKHGALGTFHTVDPKLNETIQK